MLAIVYALPSLGYPFAGDQPIHWYIGKRLLEGEMPYESGVSTKPPAVFVVHALSQLVLGDHQWSIRVFDLLFVLANAVLIATFRLRRRLADGTIVESPARRPGEIGAACVLMAGVHYTFFDFNDTAHPELWQAFFMLAPAWIVARAPDGHVPGRAAFAAGALACVGVMFKHPAALTGVLCGAALVVLALGRRSWRDALGGAALYTLGVASVLGLTLLPFWLTGTFDELWSLMVDFILEHYVPGSRRLNGAPPWLRYDRGLFAVVFALASALSGLAIARATNNRRELWLGLWVVASLAGATATVLVQKRALHSHVFNYYFIVVGPYLALCLAWGLRRALARSGGAQLAVAVLLVSAFFVYAPRWTFAERWSYRAEWSSWLEVRRGRRTLEQHWATYVTVRPVDSYLRHRAVAAQIRQLKEPGDTLCLDGFAMILYQLSDTRCPSRFFSGDGAYRGPPEWREEYERMLREDPPDLFVTFSDRPQRIRQLQRLGYERHDVRDGSNPYYVVFEHRDD